MKKFLLVKFKEGKKQQWLDWCSYLMSEGKEAAAETLPEENLKREACFIYGDHALFVYETEEGKEKLKANMDKEINQKHIALFDECFEVMQKEEGGYDISAFSVQSSACQKRRGDGENDTFYYTT